MRLNKLKSVFVQDAFDITPGAYFLNVSKTALMGLIKMHTAEGEGGAISLYAVARLAHKSLLWVFLRR